MVGRDSIWFRFVCAAVALCHLLSAPALAWCPIAHYAIAREAALDKGWSPQAAERIARCANLPDYVPSKEQDTMDGLKPLPGLYLNPYFCWSHAVQDTGFFRSDRSVAGGLMAVHGPLKPLYPDDGRYPGAIMRELFVKKLDLRGVPTERLDSMRYAINGFRSHNAADRVVHFDFFQGAERNIALSDGTSRPMT
ncbi:MAG: hypothetical protein N3A66_09560, partial [Planctomycetota bacterium]|nr:hypothetical protein [Planctomycetota bacterium]